MHLVGKTTSISVNDHFSTFLNFLSCCAKFQLKIFGNVSVPDVWDGNVRISTIINKTKMDTSSRHSSYVILTAMVEGGLFGPVVFLMWGGRHVGMRGVGMRGEEGTSGCVFS